MKKAIIIGATSGIGKGLAKILVDNNYKVGIIGRREELLAELRLYKPHSFFISTLDVTDTNSISEKLNALTVELEGLDLLVISSGIGHLNEKLDFEIEKLTIETNALGFTCVANWAFNYFANQKSGHLVAISSVGGLRGSSIAPAYNATKAFQINYIEGLRQKSKKFNVNVFVTDIRPGFVDTAMAKGDGQFWVATIDKASLQMFNAIKRKKSIAYITRRWRFVASILKRVPNRLYDRL